LKIFDAHCDVLAKLLEDPTISFQNDKKLQVSLQKLREGSGKIQCFAIYIPEKIHKAIKYDAALQSITLFYEKIATKENQIKTILTKQDETSLKTNEIGAILTLEGCDALCGDINRLKILHRLGVRSVGLTWNFANEAADGILETRNGGITSFGRSVIHYLNENNMWCDLSHCSENSFWQALEESKFPTATHSNVKRLCSHPRNLSDEQLIALFKRKAIVGINFYPVFLVDKGTATISDVVKHIDYMCSLGGEKCIGLGTDFDGIEILPEGLEDCSKMSVLADKLLQYYSEEQVNGFLYNNYSSYIQFK